MLAEASIGVIVGSERLRRGVRLINDGIQLMGCLLCFSPNLLFCPWGETICKQEVPMRSMAKHSENEGSALRD